MKTILLTILILLHQLAIIYAGDLSRSITIMNSSGRRVDIHWVHPDTGEMVLQSDPDVLGKFIRFNVLKSMRCVGIINLIITTTSATIPTLCYSIYQMKYRWCINDSQLIRRAYISSKRISS